MYAVVRHAHAGDKKSWPGRDEDRPLSDRGEQQAVGLARMLCSIEPVRLLTSPYLRCEQTLEPLGARIRRPVEHAEVLHPAHDGTPLARYLAAVGSEPLVLCTHGESLRALLATWSADPTVTLDFNGPWPAGGRTEKGAAWLVDDQDGVRTLHYVAPLHVGPVLRAG